jgi:Capsule polysaccharide biosynthesis protein
MPITLTQSFHPVSTKIMSTVVYIPSGLDSPELDIMLAKAQGAIDAGGQTTVVTCAGSAGYACSFNIYGLRSVCQVCKAQTKRGVSLLKGNFTHMETPARIDAPKRDAARNAILENRWTIKGYTKEDLDIGQAAYSSYTGLSRDQDLEGFLARWSLNRLLSTSEQLVPWFRALFHEAKATRLVLYNGRQNQYRPVLRVARQEKMSVDVMEFSGQESRCVYNFQGELPQHIGTLNEYIGMTWKNYTGDIAKCGEFYYNFKRSGGVINDTQNRSYVLGQTQGKLPDGWDASKHNIAVFNSSEDEYAAVGGDYDHTLYKNQTDAMRRLCESLHDDRDIVIWLRIHPNLSNVHWSFAERLLHLEKEHTNVHVIPGDSPVSSYALLDACNTAVSFGSTIGIEAVYWKKPSILLGRCVYEKLGSVYTPATHEEAVRLLRDRNLSPLPVEGALKTAVFWSWGGNSIDHFGGNRKEGFNFMGHRLKKTRWEFLLYSLGKFIEKYVLGNINYRFGTTQAQLRE